MVGQERILSWISNTNIKDIPHSILIHGAIGGGKHLLSHVIGEKIGVDV